MIDLSDQAQTLWLHPSSGDVCRCLLSRSWLIALKGLWAMLCTYGAGNPPRDTRQGPQHVVQPSEQSHSHQ